MKKGKSIKTFNVHGSAKTKAWEFSHHLVPPMTASTTFRLQSLKRGADGFQLFANPKKFEKSLRDNEPIWIYDRLEEPTTKMLEEQLTAVPATTEAPSDPGASRWKEERQEIRERVERLTQHLEELAGV